MNASSSLDCHSCGGPRARMLESKLISEEKQKQTKKIEELFILSLLYLLKMSKFKSYRLSTHII